MTMQTDYQHNGHAQLADQSAEPEPDARTVYTENGTDQDPRISFGEKHTEVVSTSVAAGILRIVKQRAPGLFGAALYEAMTGEDFRTYQPDPPKRTRKPRAE